MTKTGGTSESEPPEAGESRAEDSTASTERPPGIRNKTLSQLIFLKRRLVIEFVADQHDVDYSEWWMTVEEPDPSEQERSFGEYLDEDVTAGDVQEILESYEGCEGKRKAYDYLNTLREIEST